MLKFSVALSLAITLLVVAEPPASVEFTTDAPCPVSVFVASYTDPTNQSGQTTSGSTPWTLGTYPLTSVTFYYPSSVNCGGTTYNFSSASPTSPVTSGDGGTTVTVVGHYTLPDPTDITPPVWNVPADFSVEATGLNGAVVTYTATASDPDDAVSFQSCSPASGSTFALGLTTVNCTATDTHSNTGTANFNVTVVDTTPPALTLPANITVPPQDISGALVIFTASATDVVDGTVPVSCVPASGSLFPMGQTTVDCSASDSHGNNANGSFLVTVADDVPPVLTLPSDITVSAQDASGAVVNFDASAEDAVDGTVLVSCVPASGSLFPMGQTTVNCSASDSQGNTANGSFNVTVVDNVPPVLTLPSNITVTAQNASGTVVDFVASAEDAVDGTVLVTCIPASGSLFPIGQTTVNCSASDSHGNNANGSFIVSVQYAAAGNKCQGVAGHEILQPINADGSSVFKAGSTVPAKFRVCGADGVAIGEPGTVVSFRLVGIITDGVTQNVDQAVASTPPFDAFRSGSRQWIFNINTKDLDAGSTYVFLITLNDGSSIQFQFTLK